MAAIDTSTSEALVEMELVRLLTKLFQGDDPNQLLESEVAVRRLARREAPTEESSHMMQIYDFQLEFWHHICCIRSYLQRPFDKVDETTLNGLLNQLEIFDVSEGLCPLLDENRMYDRMIRDAGLLLGAPDLLDKHRQRLLDEGALTVMEFIDASFGVATAQ